MYILALNCGSSSLKYQVFDADTKKPLVSGNVEKIGLPDSFVTQKYPDGNKVRRDVSMADHNQALNVVIGLLRDASIDINNIGGVGHRVVLGGEKFANSVEITDEVIKKSGRVTCIGKIASTLSGYEQLLPKLLIFLCKDYFRTGLCCGSCSQYSSAFVHYC